MPQHSVDAYASTCITGMEILAQPVLVLKRIKLHYLVHLQIVKRCATVRHRDLQFRSLETSQEDISYVTGA
jgi:hypothetical protein